MKTSRFLILILIMLGISVAAAGCDEGPCMVTGTTDLTVYRLPTTGSDVFGTLPAGESHEILARTADGWIGFDPGIPQAPNVGLAHHRWIQLNATLGPFCDVSVPLVTLGDVEHDMGISNLNPADMAITDVQVNDLILTENAFTEVEVTIENQGDVTSSDYHLVLLSQYGTGPNQNPAGVETVPNLAPGASHTFTFSPGVSYPTAGTYTMRALLTNNWPTHADPDSTGGFGDIWDTEINVILGLCNPFADLELSLVLLSLPADTRILPVYLKVSEGIFPGFEPDNNLPPEYIASLGNILAENFNQQGFPDRAYFMFPIPPGEEGTAKYFELRLKDCADPVFVQANVLIPEITAADPSTPVCKSSLGPEECKKAGGEMSDSLTTAPVCVCP